MHVKFVNCKLLRYIVTHTLWIPLKLIHMMQDCDKTNPGHGPNYCTTTFKPSQSSEHLRGCLDINVLDLEGLPEPPSSGAVCVDLVDPTDEKKVFFNEDFSHYSLTFSF